ncbi:MtnX-like HAD-IB family phosphatase [Wohlfahrtiimonas larvae]|uniref:MtnX-like HAD-IB family phosphatase n=1 Tax=Wohlfahrtiimonas larvae TaxID=1157986 RepID=A0ABP9N2C8_9GAMM|nr:MtnX-like HAD-IB family phosphatase [Wohlfahrtiimonas larvae]
MMTSIFLCDFDGTISLKDVTDELLMRFGKEGVVELEEAWEQGEIGSKECMAGQVALLDMNQAQLDNCLADIAIDPAFREFVAFAEAKNIPIQIVSDGLDYAIAKILAYNNIPDMPILANHLVNTGERSWALEFPYSAESCKKKSGNCKCQQSDALYHAYDQIFYVGDGSSDYCVSHEVNLVYAKDKLIQYCENKGIRYQPIHSFSDIIESLS